VIKCVNIDMHARACSIQIDKTPLPYMTDYSVSVHFTRQETAKYVDTSENKQINLFVISFQF